MSKKVNRLLEPGMGPYFLVLLGVDIVTLFLRHYYLGLLELLVTVLLFGVYQVGAKRRNDRLMEMIRRNSSSLETVSEDNDNMPIPMAIVKLSDQEIIWGNELFYRCTGLGGKVFASRVTDAFPGFSLEWLSKGEICAPQEIRMESGRYRVFGNLIDHGEGPKALMASLYFVELTDLLDLADRYRDTRPVAAMILVDNYDELINGLTDSRAAAISAAIGEKLADWLSGERVSMHELARNRYLCFFEARNLARLQERRFGILESIREVKAPSGLGATLSVGIGTDAGSFEELFSFSARAIEMCLYRGGDQVVIKGPGDDNYTYYGGKTRENEHRTAVRARVIDSSLKSLLESSEAVFVMGHSYADYDAVGAAAGVYALCRSLMGGRLPIYLVYNPKNAAENLFDLLRKESAYEHALISAPDALLRVEKRSLLVVVDTNRPSQVESPELLEAMLQVNRVVVIDHHRRAQDFIAPCALAFHEPSASSASELVAEMIRYSGQSEILLPAEAAALLTGIVLDTKQFSARTGARTFEAAAYLRGAGADPAVVKTLFQSNLEDTRSKHRIVSGAFLYRQKIAVSVVEQTVDQTVAAQAADALLNVSGVASSFVLFPTGGRVKISGRSLSGSHNVQMILEPLGGGGNQETAAALIPDSDPQSALTALCRCIDRYLDENGEASPDREESGSV